jgi:hypothetical protein
MASELPEGAVVITTTQMYAEQVATTAAVTRLEGKVDSLAQSFANEQQSKAVVHADHEARLRGLERGRWPLPSLAVLIALAGLVISLLGMKH